MKPEPDDDDVDEPARTLHPTDVWRPVFPPHGGRGVAVDGGARKPPVHPGGQLGGAAPGSTLRRPLPVQGKDKIN